MYCVQAPSCTRQKARFDRRRNGLAQMELHKNAEKIRLQVLMLPKQLDEEWRGRTWTSW